MKNKLLIGIIKCIAFSQLFLVGIENLYSQKLPTDKTFSENLRMDPNKDMFPGESFDLHFDMTGFPAGTKYVALMHIDDVEIPIGTTTTGTPILATVPWETIPGKYGIKVVAFSAFPAKPKTIIVRDSLDFDPFKWITVTGNSTGKLLFNGTGPRTATLKPGNLSTGGYIQVDFHWLQTNTSATGKVVVQYSINDGNSWVSFHDLLPSIDYQKFLKIEVPKEGLTENTLIRFVQPEFVSGNDSWQINLIIETKEGNVIMPDYYENIHFTVLGNKIQINTLPSRKICTGAKINLGFTTSGNYNADNVFIAQLSDRDGWFDNPMEIGRLNDTKSGTINVTIPEDLVPGIKYRIRIIAVSGGKTKTTSIYSPLLELGPVLHSATARSGNTLTAPEGISYQWYRDNTKLPDETERTLNVTKSGNYTCVVSSEDNCSFRTNGIILQLQSTAIMDSDNQYFKLFPNPSNDVITIESIDTNLEGAVEVKIINLVGKIMLTKQLSGFAGSNLEVNIQNLDQGLYYIFISTKEMTVIKPVVKK